jgi:hypothetical protein
VADLEAGVKRRGKLDDKAIAPPQEHRIDTIQGKLASTAEQLRRRPDARQAGAGRALGHRVSEGVRRTGRDAQGAVARPARPAR